MEADFQRDYHVDLPRAVRGGMTARRLLTLVAGLPPESMWRRAAAAEPVDDPDALEAELKAFAGR